MRITVRAVFYTGLVLAALFAAYWFRSVAMGGGDDVVTTTVDVGATGAEASSSNTSAVNAVRRPNTAARSISSLPAGQWDQEVGTLSKEQQEEYRAFVDRNAEFYGDLSDERKAWMLRHGYPSPVDIARAATMSDEELQRAAWANDYQANMLLAERVLDRLTAFRQSQIDQGVSLEDIRKSPQFFEMAMGMTAASHRLESACSPFASVINARWSEVIGFMTPFESLGYWAAALDQGEMRAQTEVFVYMNQLEISGGVLNMLSTYRLMQANSQVSVCGRIEQSPP